MSTINIKIKNLPEIKAAFNKAPALMTKELTKAIKNTAITIERRSKINAPYDTGTLRRSHLTTFGTLYAVVEPKVNYAYYVHEGTGVYVGHRPYLAKIDGVGFRWMKGMKPRPFLLHAVEQEQHNTDQFFTDAVENVLSEIGSQT